MNCWEGLFTYDLCCGPEHGPLGNTGCWDEVYTYAACCAGKPGSDDERGSITANTADSDCWHGDFTAELCCGDEHGAEGNVACWDEVYTFASCCQAAAALEELGCGTDNLRRFRQATAEYYRTGLARPDLIRTFPRVAANVASYVISCAPAALQALLLAQEDRLALDPPELRLRQVAQYSTRLQHAMENGYLRASDFASWPLATGLERLRGLEERRELMHRRPNVTLVVSYCRESLEWMRVVLSRSLVPLLGLAFVRKCQGVDVIRALPLRRLWRSVDVVDVEDLPLKADECSAYFGYLAQRYDRLAEYMFFIHGDAPEHIGSLQLPNMLDDTIRAVLQGNDLPFLHLSSNRVTMRWSRDSMKVLWRGLFGRSLVPEPGEVQTYCCAHFVVSRERVRLRSQQFYLNATRFLMSPESYFYLQTPRAFVADRDAECRLSCQNMMFLWHIVFGEDLRLPHRMLDPRLPLFAKVRNVRLKYLEGDGPD